MEVDKKFILAGALFGATGVMLGALGAHALKNLLEPASLSSFNTGVKYQIYHALLLLILSILAPMMNAKSANGIFYLLVIGMLFFSFSIYLLNLGPAFNMKWKFLGPITPIGGILMIAAWIWIFLEFLKNRN